MSIETKRRNFARQWKAWRLACEIRSHHRGAVPVKKWYDECRVMMMRARRELMMELREVNCG